MRQMIFFCNLIYYMYCISIYIFHLDSYYIYIYKLKCNTCNKAYVGQSGRSINIRHKEHIRYIRTNNPLSAYAINVLQNRHEYGTIEDTLQLLKTCRKSTRMNCWETLYMQIFHQHKVLNTEQQVSDINPFYELPNTTRILPRNP